MANSTYLLFIYYLEEDMKELVLQYINEYYLIQFTDLSRLPNKTFRLD